MKRLFKFLDKTGVSIPVVMIAKKVLERMGNGFSWRRFNKIVLVGQSHLDAAWRWRTKQGIIKARATFSKAIRHIKELPEFTFAQPSPCYYEWMKRYYPKLYEEIKDAVKKGRWIPIGGMWVEADQNIPSGEALVRQRLYGQRFYLREFGFISDTEFLQDCFGFNGNLPQILKKSGAKLFGTGKLFWNETNIFPFGMMMWESPDGTQIPTILIHFGYFLPITYGKKAPRIYYLQKKGQNLRASYKTPLAIIEGSKSEELMLDNIFGYGLGDGGYGPIEAEITVVRALKRLAPKTFKYFQRGDFYGLFKKYFNRWPVWTDELYLETHRGTYTTHSIIKKMNRLGEVYIETLEKLYSVCSAYGLVSYPRDDLEKHWKLVLYNQFHDILPGSSIPEVYEDALVDYMQVLDFYTKKSSELLKIIGSILDSTESIKDSMLVVFNPLNWIRSDPIVFEMEHPFTCLSVENIKKPIQSYEKRDKKYGIVMLNSSEHCPAIGFKKYALSTEKCEIDSSKSMIRKEDELHILENELIRVKVSKSGHVASMFDKTLNFEAFNNETCEFLFFNEGACKNDAWNLFEDYKKHQIEFRSQPSITITSDGPHYAELTIIFQFQNSTIIERIGIYRLSNRLQFSIDLDWKEKEMLCKFAINSKIESDEVTSEIPYAFINRPVHRTRNLDKSRFEYSCQRWISQFDKQKNIGITVSNNSKYGFSVEGNELRMTVVRSPKCVGYAKETMFVNRASDGGLDPSKPKYSDMHYHEDIYFTIELHSGSVFNGTWKSALELNYPLAKLILSPSDDQIPKSIPKIPMGSLNFCETDKSNVLLGTIKIHEDESDLSKANNFILRLVEIAGIPTDLRIRINDQGWKEWCETDLLELIDKNTQKQPISENTIPLHIKPYEIKTILIKK